MQLVVLANETQKTELAGVPAEKLIWITDVSDFQRHVSADAFFDLQYVNTEERNKVLEQLLPKPVVINSVIDTLSETNTSFIRINGWPTFLTSPVIEAAYSKEDAKTGAEAIFSLLQKQPEWLPDLPGFVAARVVSMIINEAYLALAEGVSTKEEIDTAMKLGTAYPYGPFEWIGKIGAKNVVALLQKLGEQQARYTPSALLVEEAGTVLR